MKKFEVSITTFNIQGSLLNFSLNTYDRLLKTASYLNKVDTDILNLQELFTYYHLYIFKKKLTDFPYVAFEKFVFGPKGGLVTFSKIPIEKKQYRSFSHLKTWKKIFQGKGMLINKIKSLSISLINTHFSANRDNDWSKKNRFYKTHAMQVQQLQNVAKSEKEPLIISGDFNISKKSGLYRDMIKKLQVRDVFNEYNFPTFHNEFMSKGEKSNRIDFLFLRQKQKFTIIKKAHLFANRVLPKNLNHGFLSDHIGLEATLSFEVKN